MVSLILNSCRLWKAVWSMCRAISSPSLAKFFIPLGKLGEATELIEPAGSANTSLRTGDMQMVFESTPIR